MAGFMKKLLGGVQKLTNFVAESYVPPHQGSRPDYSSDPTMQHINDQLWKENQLEKEKAAEYNRRVEECILDLRQIALAAERRGIHEKRSYHGYTLVVGHGCARLWKGGEQLTEQEKRDVPLKVLYKFRTHFNHMVVPA